MLLKEHCAALLILIPNIDYFLEWFALWDLVKAFELLFGIVDEDGVIGVKTDFGEFMFILELILRCIG